MGSTAPRSAWCSWKKNPWAWGMSPNLKFHTPANPHTCTEQTYESNGRFLDEPWWPRLLLSNFLYLFPLSFVIHGKVLLWHEVAGFGGTCRSRKDVAGRVFGDHRPVSPGTGGSLFSSVRATRSETAAVRLVNVKLGLDSEKRKPTSYPRSLNRETTFGRRNGLHSFHCMSYALYFRRVKDFLELTRIFDIRKGGTQGFPRHEVSDKQEVLFEQNFLFVAHFVSGKPLCPALPNMHSMFARFSVSPTFLRANFWWIAPIACCRKSHFQLKLCA